MKYILSFVMLISFSVLAQDSEYKYEPDGNAAEYYIGHYKQGSDLDDLIDKLDEITQSGDMVITMGAGNIWRYCDFYVNHLKTINNGVKVD